METTRRTSGPATRPWELSLEILPAAKGPVLATEPASRSDLADCVGELWMESYLRRGRPDVPRDEMTVRLRPATKKGAAAARDPSGGMLCDGFILETEDASGKLRRSVFVPESLKLPALRAASRLIGSGALERGQTFHFRLRVDPAPEAKPPAPPSRPGVTGVDASPALVYRSVPLAPFVEAAEVVDGGGDRLHPVIYLRSALEGAERASRKGIREQPPVETGALLIGSLASCPETGEFFCLVEDALEALDAEGTSTSLTFSSRTWSRIHNILKARAAQPQTRTHRIIGQAHGHNFKPCTPAACEKCPDAGACAHLSSSAFFSIDDVRWMRSVFPGEPWAFGHVFGLSAAEKPTEALYSGFAGWMIRRGYHVIDDDRAHAILSQYAEEG
jgi:hypothetical protein